MARRKKPTPLAGALTALEAKDLPKALACLLQAWREVPAPDLAKAIDEASRACRLQQPPLGGKRGRERADHWEALAARKKPEDLERLFEDLITNASAESAIRIRRLAADHPRDPRIARWLASIITSPPFTSDNSATFWTMVAETLVEIADPRSLDYGLTALAYRSSNKMKRAQQRISAKYPAGIPAVKESETLSRVNAHLAAYAPAPKSKRSISEGAALLQAVYEAPDDDSKRLVYADWLSEQGDPRGEFIVLQLKRRQGTAPKGSATRERELLTEHWRNWLGGLSYLPRKGLGFEGGFLDTARPGSRPDPAHVEWSTCTTIDLSDARLFGTALTRFASGPYLPSMRRILGLRAAGEGNNAIDLAGAPLAKRLEVLGFSTDVSPADPAPVIPELSQFSALRELWWFDPHRPLNALESVLRNPVSARLEEFRAVNDYGDVFSLRRDAAGRLSVMTITLALKWADQAALALRTVTPGSLGELHVTARVKLADDEHLEALRAQCERIRAPVSSLP